MKTIARTRKKYGFVLEDIDYPATDIKNAGWKMTSEIPDCPEKIQERYMMLYIPQTQEEKEQ